MKVYGVLTIDALTVEGEMRLHVPNVVMQKLYVKRLACNHSPPPPVGGGAVWGATVNQTLSGTMIREMEIIDVPLRDLEYSVQMSRNRVS